MRQNSDRQSILLGKRGEDLACDYLRDHGFIIVERNWRCTTGEIDIVARDGSTLVMVEVKTRSSLAAGHPLEAITPAKLARLRLLAGAWCQANEQRSARSLIDGIRIDAIGVVMPLGQLSSVLHIRGVER
jgi:putative endonuclease